MKHLILISAAIAMVACSDETATAPSGGPGVTVPAPVTTMVGIVALDDDGALSLRIDDRLIRLVGGDAEPLRNVIGAEVEIRGTNDVDAGFNVTQFAMRRVEGRPARDGYLEFNDDGYALRQLDGSYTALIDPPAELIEMVGHRVWVAGPSDARPEAFGLLR